ncbi:serine hydrolase domain-containing protein [Oceanobacillus longus]|uniref:Serine hydrolase domain-containing protein n=1 Tax=Oceanobacillus longus TaxID=930120 RepID=A0ABV8GYW2_9BACI
MFNSYMENDYFSGGVCYIAVNDEKLFHQAYGKANSIKNTSCELHTVFDLASVTKIITTTIILKIISDTSLKLSSTLSECLPNLSVNKVLAPITLKQLMTHSSGIRAWYPFYSQKKETVFSVLDTIDVMHNKKEETVYSDLNYILLGEVAKHHFNKSLQEIVQQELVAPLDLETLTYHPYDDGNIAATEFGNKIEKQMCKEGNFEFFDWRQDGIPIVGEANDGNAYYFFNGESGHAGLFSNTTDIVKIGQLYLKGGVYKGKQFIQKSLIDEALTLQLGTRALGWEQSEIYPEGFGHTGFTGTSIWIEPKKGISVALLTNRLHVEHPRNINAFRKDIFREVHQSFS